jgi:hypothetical protein
MVRVLAGSCRGDKLDGTYVAGGEAFEGCEGFWGGHCCYADMLVWK